jgi:hypothetical protein
LKEIVILGGPNGAGKTTAARVLLPSRLRANTFINADEIARRISPANPERAALAAGRVMLRRIRELISAGTSLAFETTCAARSYAPLLEKCKRDGWGVSLIYLWVRQRSIPCNASSGEFVRVGIPYQKTLYGKGTRQAYGICAIYICPWPMRRQFTIIGTTRCGSSPGAKLRIRCRFGKAISGQRSKRRLLSNNDSPRQIQGHRRRHG